ncbi:hypothetical protein PBY51_017876 [Eleginops maclovinus]|uniref:Ig-like domain-containing protein n=1 Tax=Eleginops maclovinus TaxID=56733 RepID=A0AAN7XL08_ELEMC|nr:hypothetical protein PBY51_017876 [Eleginops maclovinus]
MSGFRHFLLSFGILGYVFFQGLWAWHVRMPRNIKALSGSCLVIPCTFDYYQYPPRRPNRVVWYQYQSHGYPIVHDSWYNADAISIFRGKTRVFPQNFKTCSLEIDPVNQHHHQQKIYPWVDPENVGKTTYRFFDTTVTIEVVDRAESPTIMISGSMKVGQSLTVQCSVYHTCPTYPPTMSVNIPGQKRRITHESMPDGTSRTTLTTTLNIERDQQTVECSARHWGGLTARVTETFTAECSFLPLTISQTSDEFLEGQPRTVTCTASFTCPKSIPTLTWNYGNMPTTTENGKSGIAGWRTVSTLTFTASSNDHGRSLTCYARLIGGQRLEKSITLRVKRNMLSRGWSFTTPNSITGMRGSCIVIPCTFTYSISQPSDLEVENNCSLKIERLDMSHNQDRLYPWVDKNPITSYHNLGHSFYDKTCQLIVSDEAQEPQMSIIGIPRVGEESTLTCSVRHTCASAPPKLTLNGKPATDVRDTLVSDWIWERTAEHTWAVKEEDQSVRCTVKYRGGQEATSELKLNVECPYDQITMTERLIEAREGVAKNVICSVSHKCKKDTPSFVWNFKDMQSALQTKRISGNTYETLSTLTFIGSLVDNRKTLTCTAIFLTGKTSDSAILHIKNKAQEPQLSILGIPRVGEESTINCSVRHTWGSAFPSLTLYGIPGTDISRNIQVSDGIWEKTAERTWAVKEEDQSVRCTVKYLDGQEATSKLKLNVECPYDQITMTEQVIEATEGVAKSVICSVSYKCKKNTPSFVWNFEDMQSSLQTKQISGNTTYETVSNLTFIGSLGDNGEPLTCTARFLTGKTSKSAILLVKKYVRPIDPYENDRLYVQDATVPFKFNALTRSCVVIPCSVPYQEVHYTRGIWSKKTGDTIYHNAQSKVIDHFKGRTKITGDLTNGDCSLEIDDIKPFDNGPFCFYAEIGHERHKFNNSCVFIVMKASPEKPVMTPVPAEVDAGFTINVSCSVIHTCVSHPPVFSWSVPIITSKVKNTMMTMGVWEMTSTITFIAAGGDGVINLTCTAISWRDKQRASTVQLTVKGSSSWPVVVAVSALSLIVIIIAAVIGVVFFRRRRRPNNSLTTPPRPEKRRSLWDRVSRRNPENRDRPPRPEKRGSIWRRFSRNKGNTANHSVGYLNNSTSVSWDFKQRCPSPKDNRRPLHSGRP